MRFSKSYQKRMPKNPLLLLKKTGTLKSTLLEKKTRLYFCKAEGEHSCERQEKIKARKKETRKAAKKI